MGGKLSVTSGMMTCTFGVAPGTFSGDSTKCTGCNNPAGTIMANVPNKNVPPFGVCQSIANPTVASATSAAMGALTPQPCTPALAAPWTPGAMKVMIENKPALCDADMLNCNWAGVIKFSFAGQVKIDVS